MVLKLNGPVIKLDRWSLFSGSPSSLSSRVIQTTLTGYTCSQILTLHIWCITYMLRTWMERNSAEWNSSKATVLRWELLNPMFLRYAVFSPGCNHSYIQHLPNGETKRLHCLAWSQVSWSARFLWWYNCGWWHWTFCGSVRRTALQQCAWPPGDHEAPL